MKFTYNEAISYIENYTWSETKLGLERTKKLLELAGSPHKKLKIIHVAGSNGKGSTCAMLSSIIKEAGYKVGLYVSPHIETFCERIQINGNNIPKNDLAYITSQIAELADSMEEHPSQFEIVTVIALKYFAEQSCDAVVLEVGMGGKLDSTNAIDAPILAVITNIGLDHTEYLGSTIEEISLAKAGIIKHGSSVICYDSGKASVDIIRSVCEEKNVPLKIVNFDKLTPLSFDLNGQSLEYHSQYESCNNASQEISKFTFKLSLLGHHQLKNAATVIEAIYELRNHNFNITDEALKKGLANTVWPARFEVLSNNNNKKEKTFILDGGHNSQCASALVDSIRDYLEEKKVIFILGMLADKDYDEVIKILMPVASSFICTTPNSPRALDADELALHISGGSAVVEKNPSEAILSAIKLSGHEPIIAFGSLYLAGEIRQSYNQLMK